MSLTDSASRIARTFIQAFVAFLTSGAIITAWNSYVANNHVDPTTAMLIVAFLTVLVATFQNSYEDKSGKKLLAPTQET